MAIDVYLQIDGIKGESTDSTHAGWIEVSSAQLGVSQPRVQPPRRPAAIPPNVASIGASASPSSLTCPRRS